MQYYSNLENVKRKNYGETEQNGSQVHLGKKKTVRKAKKILCRMVFIMGDKEQRGRNVMKRTSEL